MKARYQDPTTGRFLSQDPAFQAIGNSKTELSNIDEAYLIMYELWNHEGYLTNQGLDFLKEYYGLENLAELFSKKGGFDEAKDTKSIREWHIGIENETVI